MNIMTSFGQIKLISSNVVEVIINQGVEISLELVEEYDAVMKKHINQPYAVLINRVNSYSYAYEAILCIGSSQHLKAAAVINYGAANAQQNKNLQLVRHMNQLAIKEFSGLELGRESAIKWLEAQLISTVTEPN